MKVILIKDCKDGKENEVIETSSGYATNFLIKNGFGVPFNKQTKKALEKKKAKIQKENEDSIDNALKVKKVIEDITLIFELKVINMVVHHSITKKQIIKELKNKNITISPYMIEHIQIKSLGITKVDVKLHKDVIAKLKVEVRSAK